MKMADKYIYERKNFSIDIDYSKKVINFSFATNESNVKNSFMVPLKDFEEILDEWYEDVGKE